MKFNILVFGCQMNYADAARIRAVLTNCWFSYTENIKEADIVIFHTCSVRQKSEDKITGKLKTIRPDQKVWITGCMIQHMLRNSKLQDTNWKMKVGNFLWHIAKKNPQVMWLTTNEINFKILNSKFPCPRRREISNSSSLIPINNAFNPLFYTLTKKRKNIELMRRIDDTGFLPVILKKIGYQVIYDKELINEYEKILPDWFPTSMNTHTSTAYIPISTWCNQFCSYCIVPYARGLERNFPVEQILKEAKMHLKNWAKEIVLLGQIVNKHPEFIQIVKKLLKLKWLKRLRYTSPYPTYYSNELLALHEQEEKLCPHIHMPLQSWSDTILKRMFRGYTVQQAKAFIDNIKSLKRNISITTDIIVGFPGETEVDFKKTLSLIKYGKFDMIYIGIYSPRPGTFAAKEYPDDIPRSVKRERRKKLNDVLTDISLKNNKKEIWIIKTALINKIERLKDWNNWIIQYSNISTIEWYTDNMKQVIILNSKPWTLHSSIKVWQFIQVKITKAAPFKLYGQII